MVPSNGWLQREQDASLSLVSAPHSLQYAALLGVRARWAIGTCYEDRGIPDGSFVRVVREDLREMFPARRGLVRLRDAQGRQPYDPDILRDFQKDFTFSSLKAKIQEVPNPSLVAATVTFARAMPRSRGYEFMYPPIIATASSSRAHATTTRGASAMCFAFVQAPASFRFVSSSETTMNFHGCKLSAEFANRAAFITAWTFCSGTGSGLYLLTLFTDLMASRASMSSQTVRFGVVIISVSGPLFPPGEPSATMLGGRLAGRLRGRRGFFRQVDTDNLRHFTRSDGIA